MNLVLFIVAEVGTPGFVMVGTFRKFVERLKTQYSELGTFGTKLIVFLIQPRLSETGEFRSFFLNLYYYLKDLWLYIIKSKTYTAKIQ